MYRFIKCLVTANHVRTRESALNAEKTTPPNIKRQYLAEYLRPLSWLGAIHRELHLAELVRHIPHGAQLVTTLSPVESLREVDSLSLDYPDKISNSHTAGLSHVPLAA